MTSKTTEVTSTQAVLETVTYEYNLQNRLVSVSDGTTTVTYKYNPDGIRVQADDGTTVTDYLIDAYNHTGYAQVLEEWSGGTHPDITYTIGDDVISQYNSTDGTECLLYDGHGSTRQLVDSSEDITDAYSYDAYGVMLGGNPTSTSPAATNMLYAGEYFDTALQHYYNRARWYDTLTGRFNRMDPYSGNTQDPQSLHKYLYAHCNPINNIDPSGMYSLVKMACIAGIVGSLSAIIAGEVVRIKGGTTQQIIDAQVKWFWIGAAAGAIVYGGIWATHSMLVALYGAGAGLGDLQHAKEYGICSYRVLRSQIQGTGLEAHHIIPGRFYTLLKVSYHDMLCVAVDPVLEHPTFTEAWRNYILYGTTNVTIQEIWVKAQIIYAEYPALLEAARVQLLNAGGKI